MSKDDRDVIGMVRDMNHNSSISEEECFIVFEEMLMMGIIE